MPDYFLMPDEPDNVSQLAKDILQDKLPDSKYLFRIRKLFRGANLKVKSALVIIALVILGIIGFSLYESILFVYGCYQEYKREHPSVTTVLATHHQYKTSLGETIDTYDISATNPDWQPTITLSNGQIATITPFSVGRTNGTWITDSSKGDTPLGAGGYPNTSASEDFQLKGAPEGALLMLLPNGSRRYWTNATQTEVVTNLGTIYFMANDDVSSGAVAFEDNRGSIGVKIRISDIVSNSVVNSQQFKKQNEMTLSVLVHNASKDDILIQNKISGMFEESVGGGTYSYSDQFYRLYTSDGKTDQQSFTIESGKSKQYEITFPDDDKSLYERGAADFHFAIYAGVNNVPLIVPFNKDSFHGEPVSVTFTN